LEQLEGDKEMRAHVNLYKGEKKSKAPSKKTGSSTDVMETEETEGGDDDEEDDEKINLSELLDELVLSTSAAEGDGVDSILTQEQAAAVAAIHLSSSGFEPSDFAPSDFKFT
jgi:hypothetical protein